MNRNTLVRLLGFPATLFHGDFLTVDRWHWLRKRLPVTRGGDRLLDVGCGTGAFTIGSAKRGYDALGLSWDEPRQTTGRDRAKLLKVDTAEFDVLDVRKLDTREDLVGQFDVVICLECIEHIMDDRKLMHDMTACLKPGGRLLLTTPYFHHRPSDPKGFGPYSKGDDGEHVLRGYTEQMLRELCEDAGLMVEEISSCSAFISQMSNAIYRKLIRVLGHQKAAWAVTLPLRPLGWLFDRMSKWLPYPPASICVDATKRRIPAPAVAQPAIPTWAVPSWQKTVAKGKVA